MAKFESVPLSELKARLPAKLMRLVEESWCLRRGRREGPPEGPQGCRSVAESPGPLPFPGRGRVAQLLPRADPGSEGQGRSAEEEARASEEEHDLVAEPDRT
jgi:hypothetical protein